MSDATSQSDRRLATRPGTDRRRQAWRAFRHAYPAFLKIASTLFLFLVAVNIWLGYRRHMYTQEIERLRAHMTASEREKNDLIVQSEQDKLRMAFELAKVQARWDPQLHLSISVDSGRMYLERNGALLREMRVTVAPDELPGASPEAAGTAERARPASNSKQAKTDSAILAKASTIPPAIRPRGERAIVEIRNDSVPELVLPGGARIYGSNDTTVVTPGDVRVALADLKAILPNLSAGMLVYFY